MRREGKGSNECFTEFMFYCPLLSLAIIAFLLVIVKKGKMGRRLTPLAGLAFALIVAGIVFWG